MTLNELPRLNSRARVSPRSLIHINHGGLAFPLLLGFCVVGGMLLFAALSSTFTRSRSTESIWVRESAARALGSAEAVQTRVLSAQMSASSDASIEFALTDYGDAEANRAAALADTLAVAGSVFRTPGITPVSTTLIGVVRDLNLPGPAGRVPVLYVSLPADRANGLDWSRLGPDDLARLGIVRWLPSGVCRAWHECQ